MNFVLLKHDFRVENEHFSLEVQDPLALVWNLALLAAYTLKY